MLLWPGDLLGVVNIPGAAIVAWRCGMGHHGTTLVEHGAAAAGTCAGDLADGAPPRPGA